MDNKNKIIKQRVDMFDCVTPFDLKPGATFFVDFGKIDKETGQKIIDKITITYVRSNVAFFRTRGEDTENHIVLNSPSLILLQPKVYRNYEINQRFNDLYFSYGKTKIIDCYSDTDSYIKIYLGNVIRDKKDIGKSESFIIPYLSGDEDNPLGDLKERLLKILKERYFLTAKKLFYNHFLKINWYEEEKRLNSLVENMINIKDLGKAPLPERNKNFNDINGYDYIVYSDLQLANDTGIINKLKVL